VRFKEFAPDIGTNVNCFRSTFLISILMNSTEIIIEVWGHWVCLRVTKFKLDSLYIHFSMFAGVVYVCVKTCRPCEMKIQLHTCKSNTSVCFVIIYAILLEYI
jgi:hypothetical protein